MVSLLEGDPTRELGSVRETCGHDDPLGDSLACWKTLGHRTSSRVDCRYQVRNRCAGLPLDPQASRTFGQNFEELDSNLCSSRDPLYNALPTLLHLRSSLYGRKR